MNYDAVIVGGGMVGLATAFRLLEARPQPKLLLLEKESKLAAHQTGNNSGVLHSGLYYKPGSEKAKLSVGGLRQMIAFCREHGIAHEQCGKIVVATAEEELPRLENLWERGNANGLLGLRKLKSRANQGNRAARRRHRRDSRPAGRHRGLSGRLRKTRRTHPQGRRRNQTQRARFENCFRTAASKSSRLPPEVSAQNLSSPAAGFTPTGS